jgi:hypothetical protein
LKKHAFNQWALMSAMWHWLQNLIMKTCSF